MLIKISNTFSFRTELLETVTVQGHLVIFSFMSGRQVTIPLANDDALADLMRGVTMACNGEEKWLS